MFLSTSFLKLRVLSTEGLVIEEIKGVSFKCGLITGVSLQVSPELGGSAHRAHITLPGWHFRVDLPRWLPVRVSLGGSTG